MIIYSVNNVWYDIHFDHVKEEQYELHYLEYSLVKNINKGVIPLNVYERSSENAWKEFN